MPLFVTITKSNMFLPNKENDPDIYEEIVVVVYVNPNSQ